jgi:hypothetical protein
MPVECLFWSNGFRPIMLNFEICSQFQLALAKGTFSVSHPSEFESNGFLGRERCPIARSLSPADSNPPLCPSGFPPLKLSRRFSPSQPHHRIVSENSQRDDRVAGRRSHLSVHQPPTWKALKPDQPTFVTARSARRASSRAVGSVCVLWAPISAHAEYDLENSIRRALSQSGRRIYFQRRKYP